jgi:hypothetical protein
MSIGCVRNTKVKKLPVKGAFYVFIFNCFYLMLVLLDAL